MNEISTIKSGMPALLPSQSISDLESRCSNGLREISFRKWLIAADHALSEAERETLGSRRGELDRLLSRGDKRLVEAALLSLFLGYPALQRQGDEQSAMMLAKYRRELERAPVWAVQKACSDFSRGYRGKPGFPPSVAELVQVVDGMLEQPREEFWRLTRILTADVEPTPPTQEERDRAAARIQGLFGELRASLELSKLDDAKRRAETLERSKVNDGILRAREWATAGVTEPPKISKALADNLDIAPFSPRMQQAAE